jgi:methyl-accepting chemotaxis protein
VQLLERLEESDLLISKFMDGFEMNDAIKDKIAKTQTIVNELVNKENLNKLDEESVLKLFQEYQAKNNFIEFMAIVNSKGYATISTIEIPENYRDASAKIYYQKACRGESYISPEYISTASGNYNISVTAPLYSGGTFSGLVIADINLNE